MVDVERTVYEFLLRTLGLTVNEIWGHLIYKPIKTARWRIPYGLKTLEEFLRWHESRGLVQRRLDHPIALEVYCRFTTRKPLTDEQFRHVVLILTKCILQAFFYPELLDYMEWGYEFYRTKEPEPLEARIRFSRDGIEFKYIDITKKVRKWLMIRYIE